MPTNRTAVFLFSIDVEDTRMSVPDGASYQEAVPRNMATYLEFLDQHDARCTFFTVGDVARRYPQLVHDFIERGHEVACHSSDHLPLDQHDPASFRDDLQRNLEDLQRAGAEEVRGFRAPTLSLTKESCWAHEVLAELGFLYSSSVLPARNPLFGWPGFPEEATQMDSGIWEIPLTLSGIPGLNVPFAAGVYFRVLPSILIRRLFQRTLSRGHPVVSYFHPYDIDTEQEHFMHSGLGGNRFYNWLMYRNRNGVIPELDRIVSKGARIIPYASYVSQVLEGEKSELQVRPFIPSPQGLKEAATLLRSTFTETSHINSAYLEWNYLRNPDGEALAFNAYDAGELVAHFASSPMRARIFGREEIGLLTQHAVTKPQYEGRGLFKRLVEVTMRAGTQAGYGFAIAMANANSVFAFTKRLGFEYVCHLDVRVGIGPSPKGTPSYDVDFERLWTPEALKWRLSRPDDPYRVRRMGDRVVTYTNSGILGIQVELGTFPMDLVEPPPPPDLRTHNPARVWIGLDPARRWQFRPYVNLPVRLRPTPLNFTIRDLTSQQRHFRPDRLLLNALDFDAY